MNLNLFIIGIIAMIISYRNLWKRRIPKEKAARLIRRFLRTFTSKKDIIRGYEGISLDSLIKDPDRNIELDALEVENDLRKKADIHQTRLSKFGRSKINGQMIFKGPRGGIYRYTNTGRKIYVK